MGKIIETTRKGSGKALVREGLSLLKALGAKGCILVGDPGYYERFGFRSHPGVIHEGVPPQYVLSLPFEGTETNGIVTFHEGYFAQAPPEAEM